MPRPFTDYAETNQLPTIPLMISGFYYRFSINTHEPRFTKNNECRGGFHIRPKWIYFVFIVGTEIDSARLLGGQIVRISINPFGNL